jgi:ABC-type branched-subunit amino acid transport system ATPase component
MKEVEIASLRPVQLVLRNIGPFRGERPTLVRFLGPHADFGGGGGTAGGGHPAGSLLPRDRELRRSPANMFLVLADNGDGKTSMLETIHGLLDMLSAQPDGNFVLNLSADAQAQLDLRVGVAINGVFREILLSIWFGSDEPLVDWAPFVATRDAWQARSWAGIGLMRGRPDPASCTNQLGRSILEAIRQHEGTPLREKPNRSILSPTATEARSSILLRRLPCTLYFPTNRNLGRRALSSAISALPAYRPALKFDSDELRQEPAVEAVLNAIGRDDPERLFEILTLLNAALLVHPERPKKVVWDLERGRCRIEVAGSLHEMSGLSDGERSFLTLHARVLIHMTRATTILVDEVDIHMHPKWTKSLFDSLAQMVRRFPGTTLIFTTHNRELAKAFDHRRIEDGLVKGGLVAPKGLFG